MRAGAEAGIAEELAQEAMIAVWREARPDLREGTSSISNRTAPMPHIVDADEAAARISAGLEDDRFEIHFPKALSRRLKLLRCLPYSLFFRITRRLIAKTGRR